MEKESPLVNVQVFYRHRTKFGIPSEVFLILVFINVFALIFCIMHFSVPLLLAYCVFFLISVLPMKFIFKEDPQSHRAWISGLMKPDNLDNTMFVKRKIKFL